MRSWVGYRLIKQATRIFSLAKTAPSFFATFNIPVQISFIASASERRWIGGLPQKEFQRYNVSLHSPAMQGKHILNASVQEGEQCICLYRQLPLSSAKKRERGEKRIGPWPHCHLFTTFGDALYPRECSSCSWGLHLSKVLSYTPHVRWYKSLIMTLEIRFFVGCLYVKLQ